MLDHGYTIQNKDYCLFQIHRPFVELSLKLANQKQMLSKYMQDERIWMIGGSNYIEGYNTYLLKYHSKEVLNNG